MSDPLPALAQFLFAARDHDVLVAWFKKSEIPHKLIWSLESCRNCRGKRVVFRKGGPLGDYEPCRECNKDGLCSTPAVELKFGEECWMVRFHKNGKYRDMVWT